MPNNRHKKRTSPLAGLLFAVFLAVAACLILREPVEREVDRYLYPVAFEAEIDAAAEEFGLERELILAVIHTESRFVSDAVSRAGAKGLMQLTDDTNDWVAMLLREESEPERIFEPELNIRRGCCLLAYLLREFGETEVALAAYNAGIGRVSGWLEDERYSSDGVTLSHIPIEETREYVKRVAEAREVYRELAEEGGIMLTWIFSIGEVIGAEAFAVGFAVSFALIFALGLISRTNRTKRGILRLFAALVLSSVVADVVMYVTFYSGGEYVNRGLGAAYATAAIFTALHALGAVAATVVNAKKRRSND